MRDCPKDRGRAIASESHETTSQRQGLSLPPARKAGVSSSRFVILSGYFRALRSGNGPAKNLAFHQIVNYWGFFGCKKGDLPQMDTDKQMIFTDGRLTTPVLSGLICGYPTLPVYICG